MNNNSKWTDRLAVLGGGDLTVLRQVPMARARFAQMGLVLLATSGLAVASMSFAMRDGLHAPMWIAPIIGLVWGWVILTIDRMLVLSMGAVRGLRQIALMAVPRLVAAALISIVVSTPFVLRIFDSEINEQVFQDQLVASHSSTKLLDGTQYQADADRLQKQIDGDNAILAGHLPTGVTSPALQDAQGQVNALTQQTAAAKQAMNDALEQWQCELYGAGAKCHDASNAAGEGPLADAKRAEYHEAVATYQAAERQLNAAEQSAKTAQGGVDQDQSAILSQAQSKARSELPDLEREQANDNTTLNELRQHSGQTIADSDGILAQLRALSELDKSSSTLRSAHYGLAGLLFVIEIMPVLVKLLLALGSGGAYEVVSKAEEEDVIDNRRVLRREDRQILEDKSNIRIIGEKDMRDRELALIKHANEVVAAKMKEIIDGVLQQWATAATANTGATSAPLPASLQLAVPLAPTTPSPPMPATVVPAANPTVATTPVVPSTPTGPTTNPVVATPMPAPVVVDLAQPATAGDLAAVSPMNIALLPDSQNL